MTPMSRFLLSTATPFVARASTTSG